MQNSMIMVMTLLLMCCLLQGTAGHPKSAYEQYNRKEFGCTQRCERKGYFKYVCIRVCLSPQCFQQVYAGQGGEVKGLLEF